MNKNKKYFSRHHRGFTLIELLIVIAIIGILASIILVSLSSARNKSKMGVNQAEIKQLVNLFHQQFDDTGSYSPLIVNGWIPASYDCDSIPVSGTYANDYRKLCNSIMTRLGTDSTSYNWLVGDYTGTGQNFSIMVKASPAPGTGGEWFCIGSSGSTYMGPYNSNAKGCYNNP